MNILHSTDSSSASSGASSSGDGTGTTFTHTSNNGQGIYTSNGYGPGYVSGTNGFANPGYVNPGYVTPGFVNDRFGSNAGYYGPSNYNPSNYGSYGTAGHFGNYGPNFNYPTYPNVVPQYQPSGPFGFQAPFAPQPILTPQQFNQQLTDYVTSLQKQYAR